MNRTLTRQPANIEQLEKNDRETENIKKKKKLFKKFRIMKKEEKKKEERNMYFSSLAIPQRTVRLSFIDDLYFSRKRNINYGPQQFLM